MAGSATLREGIYLINSQVLNQKERLDLSNGNWRWGTVQIWDSNEIENSNGFRNQRWMITRVRTNKGEEEDQDFYHLTNSFYGCLVGVWRNYINGSWKVEAGPCSTDDQRAHWGFRDVGGGTYTLYWRPDPNRCLTVARWLGWFGYSHGTIEAMPSTNETSQTWTIVEATTGGSFSNSSAKWMTYVPGSLTLSQLNLVGTHQCLSSHGVWSQAHEGSETGITGPWSLIDNPRCQNRSPYEQLIDGVRLLDCRFATMDSFKTPHLYAYHGGSEVGAEQGYSFTALLQSVKLFLQQFPSETIIVQAKNDPGRSRFEKAFRSDFLPFEDLFFKNDKRNKQTMSQITLEDVRGKAVMLTNDIENISSYTAVFSQNVFLGGDYGQTIFKEYAWDLGRDKWQLKLDNCAAMTDQAKANYNHKHAFQVSWNMSNALSLYNPIDFFLFARQTILHTYSPENIGINGMYRIGLVEFDFYEQVLDAVRAIIKSNKGCGDLNFC